MNRIIGNGFNDKWEQYEPDYIFKNYEFPSNCRIPKGRDFAIAVSQHLLKDLASRKYAINTWPKTINKGAFLYF